MKRRVSLLLIVLSMFMVLSPIANAHSGRTDSNGGHKDNKNKSGLGSYHYHCGGHPPHLHKDGKCPYNTKKDTSTASSKSNTSTKILVKLKLNQILPLK